MSIAAVLAVSTISTRAACGAPPVSADTSHVVAVDYPYNPDSDASGAIGTEDLLSLLAEFATTFVPASLVVDGMTLEQYLALMYAEVEALQAAVDAVSAGNCTCPSEMGVFPGQVATWTGEGWTMRLMYGCPHRGASNYVGNWPYPGIEDASVCVWDAPVFPFNACDDGNAMTYNDRWNSDATVCAGSPCNGTCSGLPCDDGNALTFADRLNGEGAVCTGDPCSEGHVACDGSGPCNGVPYLLFDRKVYDLVEIGNQCWFRENLATRIFQTGDSIPAADSNAKWAHSEFPVQTVYSEPWNGYSSLETAGRVYNAYAVHDPRGLCPSGFHVPSDEDWLLLEAQIGFSAEHGYIFNSPLVLDLVSSPGDTPPSYGTNALGFSAVPNPWRALNYEAYWNYNALNGSSWWTSTTSNGNMLNGARRLDHSVLYRWGEEEFRSGHAVRCVAD